MAVKNHFKREEIQKWLINSCAEELVLDLTEELCSSCCFCYFTYDQQGKLPSPSLKLSWQVKMHPPADFLGVCIFLI